MRVETDTDGGEERCARASSYGTLIPSDPPVLTGGFQIQQLLMWQRWPGSGASHCGSIFLIQQLPDHDRVSHYLVLCVTLGEVLKVQTRESSFSSFNDCINKLLKLARVHSLDC